MYLDMIESKTSVFFPFLRSPFFLRNIKLVLKVFFSCFFFISKITAVLPLGPVWVFKASTVTSGWRFFSSMDLGYCADGTKRSAES